MKDRQSVKTVNPLPVALFDGSALESMAKVQLRWPIQMVLSNTAAGNGEFSSKTRWRPDAWTRCENHVRTSCLRTSQRTSVRAVNKIANRINVKTPVVRASIPSARCKSTIDLPKNVTFSHDLDIGESLKGVNYSGSDYSEIYNVSRSHSSYSVGSVALSTRSTLKCNDPSVSNTARRLLDKKVRSQLLIFPCISAQEQKKALGSTTRYSSDFKWTSGTSTSGGNHCTGNGLPLPGCTTSSSAASHCGQTITGSTSNGQHSINPSMRRGNSATATCLDNEAPSRADPCGYVTLRLDTPPASEVIRIPVVQEATTCPSTSVSAMATSAIAATTSANSYSAAAAIAQQYNAGGGHPTSSAGGGGGVVGVTSEQRPPTTTPATVTAVDLEIDTIADTCRSTSGEFHSLKARTSRDLITGVVGVVEKIPEVNKPAWVVGVGCKLESAVKE